MPSRKRNNHQFYWYMSLKGVIIECKPYRFWATIDFCAWETATLILHEIDTKLGELSYNKNKPQVESQPSLKLNKIR